MAYQTCAEINLEHLVHNYRAIQSLVGRTRVIPVIKADAYGHGAVQVARCLSQKVCWQFAVAHFDEAMELRGSGVREPILVFGRLQSHQIIPAAKAGLRMTLFSAADLDMVEKSKPPQPVTVHVKVDTGMGRVGVIPGQELGLFERLSESSAVVWEGLYTHFATSDEKDASFAQAQIDRFNQLIDRLHPHRPPVIHMANSGGVLAYPASYYHAVRPGIMLYGHYPSSEVKQTVPLKQVMTFKTYVAHVRHLPADHPISYGRRWRTPHPTTVAVIPVGYADGLQRRLTNRGKVLINGKRYPIVGTVTMDQTMVHVGEDPVQVGDEVILWGGPSDGNDEIQLLDVAETIDTIPYDLTCGVSKRVKRVYVSCD